MTLDAGSVTSTLSAIAAPFVKAYDEASAAMMRSKSVLDKFAAAMLIGSNANEKNAFTAQALAKTVKDTGQQVSRAAGAMGGMAMALGTVGGESQKATQAFGAFAGMIGAGGPVGIALAAAAAAMQLVNAHIAEQQKLMEELDKQWEKYTKETTQARDAAVKGTEEQASQIELLGKLTGDPKQDRALKLHHELNEKVKDNLARQLDLKAQLVKATNDAATAGEKEKEKADQLVQALELAIDHRTTINRELEKQAIHLPDVVEAEDRAAKIAEKRAEHERKIKEALEDQKKLLKDIANGQFFANLLPNGGALQSTGPLTPASDQGDFFPRLTTPKVLQDRAAPFATEPAKGIEDLIAAAQRAGAEVNTFAVNLPPMTKSARQAKDELLALTIAAEEAKGAFVRMAENLLLANGKQIAPEDIAEAIRSVGAQGATPIGAGLGAVAGAAVAPVLGLPPQVGAGLGELIGSIAGDAMNELANSLQILTPLFDAVAVVIAALTPVLLPLKVLFQGIGLLLITSWVHPIEIASTFLGAFILILAHVVESVAPLLGIVTDLILTAFLVPMQILTPLLIMLADVMVPLVSVVIDFYNTIAVVINTIATTIESAFNIIIDGVLAWVNDLLGTELAIDHIDLGLPQIDMLHYETSTFADLMAAVDANTEATEGNTDVTREQHEQTEQNLPSGYKVGGGIYDAIAVGATAGDPVGTGARPGGYTNASTTINIGTVYIRTKRKQFIDEAAEELQARYGAQHGGGPGPPDDIN